MKKEEIIKFLLEDALGLHDENEMLLITEEVSSVEGPDYEGMKNYYTRFETPRNDFKKLNDKEKVYVLNTVNKIVNGGTVKRKHPSDRIPSTMDGVINTMLAAEYIHPDESTGGWSPDSVDTQNIYEHLLTYYNPYSSGDQINFVAFKAFPKYIDPRSLRSSVAIELALEAFYLAVKSALQEKKYDPNKSTFDSYFFQTWRNDIANEFSKTRTREKFNVDPTVKGTGDEEGENIEIASLYGEKDPEYSLASDKEKYNIILSKLGEGDQAVLRGFYNFIFQESGSENEALSKFVNDLMDEEGDIEELEPEEGTKEKESMYDYIAKELGVELTKNMYDALKKRVSLLRNELREIFRDPKFKEQMGIENWSEKYLDILKGTGTKGRDWKKNEKGYWKTQKSKESEFGPQSGAIYDASGKPIQLDVDDEGKRIFSKKGNVSEIMFECVEAFNNNFNYRFNKINRTLDRINKIESFINEGFDVAVKDLDQDIYGYLNNTVEGLNKAIYMLNELEMVGNDIKFDYPEVSEKISEYITPLISEVGNLISKVKMVKGNIKPFLSESTLKKKVKSDDDELEEERITNPESKEFVKKRENFIGSHIYGEDLGGLGKMYVSYSYGEQFPTYLWYNDKWYHNANNYVLDDGTVNEPTNQHKNDMRPVQDTHGLSTLAMNTMIRKFKAKHGLGDNVHTDVEPGEKN
jgi:hypothetical protein